MYFGVKNVIGYKCIAKKSINTFKKWHNNWQLNFYCIK